MMINFKQAVYDSASFLVLCLGVVLVLSNVTFMVGGSLNPFIIPVSFLGSIFFLYFNSKNILYTFVSASLAILVALAGLFMAVNIYDTSWDGQGYHQEAVYLLKNGWNPIYGESGSFRNWVNLYQNGNETLQANIYLLTDKIEAGKMTNLVFAYAAFGVVLRFLDGLNLKLFTKLIIAFITVMNPVVFTQLFTYYVDGNWYLTLVISLASLLTYLSNKNFIALVVFVLSAVIFCSLKFSSIPVFVVFSAFAFGYGIFYLKRNLLRPYLVIGVLTILCNIHPFSSNIRSGEHILHPFAGAKKIDIINQNIPNILINKNRFERLFISLFSQTGNNFNAADSESLKIPFTANKNELFINYDTRIGGFGFLFSGVLLLSVFLAIFLLIKEKDRKIRRRMLFVYIGLTVSILINPANWWSRLSPQIWLLPVSVMVFAMLSENRRSKLASYFIIAIFLINILLPGYISYRKLKDDQKQMNDFVNSVGNKTIILDLSSHFAFQQYYLKFKEKNIKYKIERVVDQSKVAPFTPDVYFKIKGKP